MRNHSYLQQWEPQQPDHQCDHQPKCPPNNNCPMVNDAIFRLIVSNLAIFGFISLIAVLSRSKGTSSNEEDGDVDDV